MLNQIRVGLAITRSKFKVYMVMFLDRSDEWAGLINYNWKFLVYLCEVNSFVFIFHIFRIIFLFHKNGQMSYKAKVKPPRLNGQRVGVYSTRSPHRPNALGLTLAKLEGITGTTYLQDWVTSRTTVLNQEARTHQWVSENLK